jgi:hypothetical protein
MRAIATPEKIWRGNGLTRRHFSPYDALRRIKSSVTMKGRVPPPRTSVKSL